MQLKSIKTRPCLSARLSKSNYGDITWGGTLQPMQHLQRTSYNTKCVLHMWAKMVSETDDRSQTASHCPSNRDVSCDILLKSLLELKLSDTFSSD